MLIVFVVWQAQLVEAEYKLSNQFVHEIEYKLLSHHVCAVGKFANVGAAVIWNFGFSSYKTNKQKVLKNSLQIITNQSTISPEILRVVTVNIQL